jgi:hypothetical protein
MPVGQTLEFAKLEELSLDPMNPRLGRHHAGKSVKQKDVLALMETWKLDELAVSFLESGQFWTQEALICVREELYGKERLVVVEGNRRLAALICLKETFDGHRKDRTWKEIVDGKQQPKNLFDKIPYLIASDRKSVEAFLGFRHVTGIEQWRPSEKAEFISRMVDHGMSYEEVRKKIGARPDTVRRNYISHRLRLQIEKTGSVPEDSFEERFSVMFLSLRTSGVQKYLRIDITAPPERAQEPVPKKHLDALKNFAVWLFGSESRGPLFTDSRQVDTEIARRLCGEVGNLKRWNKKEAKEQGLDILCYRQFRDSRGNFPAFFVQCASGQNFIKKLKEPDLGVWNDLVKMVPTSLARKAFSTPFMFPKKQFDQHAIRSEGLLLDRGRLLSSAIHIETWIEPKTAKQILKWAKPHINKLPWTE